MEEKKKHFSAFWVTTKRSLATEDNTFFPSLPLHLFSVNHLLPKLPENPGDYVSALWEKCLKPAKGLYCHTCTCACTSKCIMIARPSESGPGWKDE